MYFLAKLLPFLAHFSVSVANLLICWCNFTGQNWHISGIVLKLSVIFSYNYVEMPASSLKWYSPSLICTSEARLRVLQNWQDFYACGGPLLRNKLAHKDKYKIQNTQYQIQRPSIWHQSVIIANTKKNCCWLTAGNSLLCHLLDFLPFKVISTKFL